MTSFPRWAPTLTRSTRHTSRREPLFRDFRKIATSIEIQQRERGLRIALEATTDRLRDFARSASDSFWESDRGGQVTFAAGPAAAISGLRSGVALNDVLLAGGIDPPKSVELEKEGRGPQPLRHLLSFRQSVDGEVSYIELRGAPAGMPTVCS